MFSQVLNRAARSARALSIPIALLLVPGTARADVTLTGTVSDHQSHQPIAGAIVAADAGHARTTTDESGRFTLTSVQAVQHLAVTRLGYVRLVLAVTGAGPLAIELEPAPLQQQGLEVTGRAVGHAQLEDASTRGTLTTQDLRRGDGLQLENSINTLPGVMMQSRTPWGGAHIQIRGYYPNYSQNSNGYGYQLFLNDMPVTDATGLTILDDVDFSALGRVEVLNGPVSSRFGTAIGGTVNFWTDSAAPGTQTISQGVVGGSDKLFRTNTTYALGTDNSSMVVNYGHQTYDSFRPNSASKKDFARFTGEFRLDPKQSIATYFSYNNSFEQLAGELDLPDFTARRAIDNPVYEVNHSRIAIESERIGFTHALQVNDALDTRSTLYASTQTMAQPFAHGYNSTNRFTFGARSALGVRANAGAARLDGSVGVSFQRTNYTVNGYFVAPPGNPTAPGGRPSDQENYGMVSYAFTEWNASLPHDVVVTAGGNLSVTEFGYRNMLAGTTIAAAPVTYRKAFDPRFLPRGSVLKKFADEFSVYASVGTGYTPPSLTNIVSSNNAVNTGLKPESATQFEVGSKGLVWNKRISWAVAAFDLDIKDKLVSQTVSAVTSTVNVGEQRNKGIELTLSGLVIDDPSAPVTMVRPWLSYTYSEFKYTSFKSNNNNNAGTVDFSGKTAARSPKNVMNLGLDVKARCGGYLFASYQHVDQEYVTFDNSTSVGAYRLVSAKLGWKTRLASRWNLDLSGGGDNLTNSTYYKFIFIGPNYAGLAQAKDGGTGDGYILPGPYNATYYGNAVVSYSF